ncbi:MAG: DNA cytosine methyltransferase [Gemmatimonadaceae bacterium]
MRKVLSLYTGAGGLDLGLEAAGFQVVACVESDPEARRTLQRNRPGWKLADPGDVHEHKPEDLLALSGVSERELRILSGGPPCQPFSKARYWRNGRPTGLDDPRAKTLDALLDLVEEGLPDVMLLENVAGIASARNGEALDLVRRRLDRINRRRQTRYEPQLFPLDAVDYGVPQRRERLFILAVREGDRLALPPPTHHDLELAVSRRAAVRLRTAWDAIGDVEGQDGGDDLSVGGAWGELLPSIPEGKNYLWHTPQGGGEPLFGWRTRYWSFLLKLAKDKPSWTLQAAPGPSTGPFHWKNRRLSRAEMCRLQTFPEGFVVEGTYPSAQRQLGNAVPAALGELLGLAVRREIYGERVRRRLRLIPFACNDCPSSEPPERVVEKFWHRRGPHAPHPGTGRGPGALKRNAGLNESVVAMSSNPDEERLSG